MTDSTPPATRPCPPADVDEGGSSPQNSLKAHVCLHTPSTDRLDADELDVADDHLVTGQRLDASCELLRTTVDALAGLPKKLKAADSLTASIYVEAACRNLHHAADLITIDAARQLA